MISSEVSQPAASRWTRAGPVGVTIRPFRRADQAAVRRLILEGLGEHFGHLNEALNPDLDSIAAEYVERGHVFLVAEVGAELAATGALVIENGVTGRIVRVSVAPGHRRRGLGRAIIGCLLAAARARGLARIWVETNDDWAAAIELYRACGFREYAREDGCVYLELDL